MHKILYFDDDKVPSGFMIKCLQLSNPNLDITYVSDICSFFNEIKAKDKGEYSLIIMDVLSFLSEDCKDKFDKSEIQSMNDGMYTGRVVIEKIKAIYPAYKDVKVIFYTILQDIGSNNKNYSIIHKPALSDELLEEINKQLNIIEK